MSTLIIHSQSEIFICIESELIERSFTADDKIVRIQSWIQLKSHGSGFAVIFAYFFSPSLTRVSHCVVHSQIEFQNGVKRPMSLSMQTIWQGIFGFLTCTVLTYVHSSFEIKKREK